MYISSQSFRIGKWKERKLHILFPIISLPGSNTPKTSEVSLFQVGTQEQFKLIKLLKHTKTLWWLQKTWNLWQLWLCIYIIHMQMVLKKLFFITLWADGRWHARNLNKCSEFILYFLNNFKILKLLLSCFVT